MVSACIVNHVLIDNNIRKNFNLKEYYILLHQLYKKDSNIHLKLYEHKPKMITFKYKKQWTLLIFMNGKLRLQGKCLAFNTSTINQIISSKINLDVNFSKISETVVFNLPKQCNIYSLLKLDKSLISYEFELFAPAITINKFKPLFINAFFSRKIVIMGKNAFKTHLDVYNWFISICS